MFVRTFDSRSLGIVGTFFPTVSRNVSETFEKSGRLSFDTFLLRKKSFEPVLEWTHFKGKIFILPE
jgi:hypothetical protein